MVKHLEAVAQSQRHMLRVGSEILVVEAAAVAAAVAFRVKGQSRHQDERRLVVGLRAVRDRLREIYDQSIAELSGALSDDLAQVLARIRTGEPVGAAFESLARATGLPIVARFATGITVAMERGTPLADVLHAQAADVREAGRRLLIETAARKEIAMMAPVVFFVLPVTILFAFYPGVLGLRLTTP